MEHSLAAAKQKPPKALKATAARASRRAAPAAASLVTRQELAQLLGVNPRTVAKLLEEGMPVARRGRGGRPSLYDPAKCLEWKDARDQVAGLTPANLVAQERARRERAQAMLAEQMLAMRAGKLVDIDEVTRRWAAEIAGARAVILQSYTVAADRVFAAAQQDGLAGVERELKALAHEVLRELAGGASSEAEAQEVPA